MLAHRQLVGFFFLLLLENRNVSSWEVRVVPDDSHDSADSFDAPSLCKLLPGYYSDASVLFLLAPPADFVPFPYFRSVDR